MDETIGVTFTHDHLCEYSGEDYETSATLRKEDGVAELPNPVCIKTYQPLKLKRLYH